MDIILYNILVALGCLIIGFLIGGFPTAVFIGKVFFHKDIREYGSGNPGGTNAGRVLGKRVGLIVIIIDMLKAVLVIYSCWAVLEFTGLKEVIRIGSYSAPYYYLAALGASLGHCFSPYLHFKGGKTVSVFIGTVAGCSWLGFIISISYFAFLKLKKYVSLAGIIIACVDSVFAWTLAILSMTLKTGFDFNILMFGFGLPHTLVAGWEYATVVTLIGILLIVRHSSNIKRIQTGTERKITWMK